jgi:hypothetical protein
LASLGLLEDDHQKLEAVSVGQFGGEPARLRAPTGATIATTFNATVVVFILAAVVAGVGTEGKIVAILVAACFFLWYWLRVRDLVWRGTVDGDGISGRTLGGQRFRVQWSGVRNARVDVGDGRPRLRFHDSSGRKYIVLGTTTGFSAATLIMIRELQLRGREIPVDEVTSGSGGGA